MKAGFKLIEIATLTVSTLACVAVFGFWGGDELFKLDLSPSPLLPFQLLFFEPMLATVIAFKLGIDDFVMPRMEKTESTHPYHQICLLASFVAMLAWGFSGHNEVGIGGDAGGFPVFWTSGYVWFYCLVGAPVGCMVSLAYSLARRQRPGPKFPWLSAITVFALCAVSPLFGCLREIGP